MPSQSFMPRSDCPTLTVLLPIRNGESFIGRCLASIIDQTYEDWELIVLDDRSTDGTVAVVRAVSRLDDRIALVPAVGRSGLVDRLNQGLAYAQAPLIARMDVDDVAHPERFQRQIAVLRARPDVDLVGCSMAVFGPSAAVRGLRRAPELHDDICRRPWAGFRLFHPTWVARIEWMRTHRYSIRAQRCEDQELLLRTWRHSRFANVSAPLLAYYEGRLELRKVLLGRKNYTRAAVEAYWRKGQRGAVAMAVAEHSLKAGIDCAATVLHLERMLLRHRADPVDPATAACWEDLLRFRVDRGRRLLADAGYVVDGSTGRLSSSR